MSQSTTPQTPVTPTAANPGPNAGPQPEKKVRQIEAIRDLEEETGGLLKEANFSNQCVKVLQNMGIKIYVSVDQIAEAAGKQSAAVRKAMQRYSKVNPDSVFQPTTNKKVLEAVMVPKGGGIGDVLFPEGYEHRKNACLDKEDSMGGNANMPCKRKALDDIVFPEKKSKKKKTDDVEELESLAGPPVKKKRVVKKKSKLALEAEKEGMEGDKEVAEKEPEVESSERVEAPADAGAA